MIKLKKSFGVLLWFTLPSFIFVFTATSHKYPHFALYIFSLWELWAHDLAMPCWWGLTRPKQLYMAVKSWAHLIFLFFFGRKGSIPSTVVAVRRFIVVYVTILHFRIYSHIPQVSAFRLINTWRHMSARLYKRHAQHNSRRRLWEVVFDPGSRMATHAEIFS